MQKRGEFIFQTNRLPTIFAINFFAKEMLVIYSFENRIPKFLGENYFIAQSADVIGSVIVGNNVSILFNSVIRADNEIIEIGDGTNVQDGAILHTDPGIPMKIGKNVTIAHNAMLHGCSVGDNSVIAIGAVIMNNATIGKNCIIGARSKNFSA